MKKMQNLLSGIAARQGLFIFAITLYSVTAQGQFSDFIYPLDTAESSIKFDFYGHAGFDTDAITQGLIKSFVDGGYIPRENFDKSYPVNDLNSVAVQAGTALNFNLPKTQLFGNEKLHFNINYFVESQMTAQYTDDAFGLVFYGNKRFLGDTAFIDNSNLQEWTFHSLGIGLYNEKTNSSLSLNYYHGLSRNDLEINEGFLYTSDSGQLLASEVDGEFISSHEVSTEVANSFGSGIGINGLWNIPLNENEDLLSFEFRNLGIMTWPDKLQKQTLDSLYNFEGIDLSNTFDNEAINDTISSINDFYSFDKTIEKRSEMLPARLRLNYLKRFGRNNFINAGVSTQQLNDWDPEYRIGFTHRFKRQCFLGAEIKYGGYGNENFNLHAKFLLTKSWIVRFNASYLEGLVASDGYGGFIGFGITKLFNLKSNDDEG